MNKYKGEFILLLVAVIWGSSFVGSAIALQQFEPFQLTSVRFLLSAAILAAIYFGSGRRLSKASVKYGAALGVLLFAGYAFQTMGLWLSTPSKNAFITSVNVIIVPFIGAVIYRRRVDAWGVVGAVITLIGIGLLSLRIDAPVNTGDMLTLVSAFFFALHIFFTGEYMNRDTDAMSLVVVQMPVVSMLSFIASAAFGQMDYSGVNLMGLITLTYLALFCTSLCFFLQTWAQRLTTETKAAIILSTECVFGALISVLLRYEIMTPRMIISFAIILGGILIAELKPSLGVFKKN